jgi:hypothetical protein
VLGLRRNIAETESDTLSRLKPSIPTRPPPPPRLTTASPPQESFPKYGYGKSFGDAQLPLTDVSYKLRLANPLRFYGDDYDTLHILV